MIYGKKHHFCAIMTLICFCIGMNGLFCHCWVGEYRCRGSNFLLSLRKCQKYYSVLYFFLPLPTAKRKRFKLWFLAGLIVRFLYII